jgi:hypothetical protein
VSEWKPVGINADGDFPPRVEARLQEKFGGQPDLVGVWTVCVFPESEEDAESLPTTGGSLFAVGGGIQTIFTVIDNNGQDFSDFFETAGAGTTVSLVGIEDPTVEGFSELVDGFLLGELPGWASGLGIGFLTPPEGPPVGSTVQVTFHISATGPAPSLQDVLEVGSNAFIPLMIQSPDTGSSVALQQSFLQISNGSDRYLTTSADQFSFMQIDFSDPEAPATHNATLWPATLSADQVWTLPDASGTLMLEGSIPAAPPITQTTLVTASLAPGAREEVNLEALGSNYKIYAVYSETPARIRFYPNDLHRNADATRPVGTDPAAGTDHGVMLDVALSAGVYLNMSPIVEVHTTSGDDWAIIQVDNRDTVARVVTIYIDYRRLV